MTGVGNHFVSTGHIGISIFSGPHRLFSVSNVHQKQCGPEKVFILKRIGPLEFLYTFYLVLDVQEWPGVFFYFLFNPNEK